MAFLTSDPYSSALLLQQAQDGINSISAEGLQSILSVNYLILLVSGGLSVFITLLFPPSTSHVGRQVLQRRGGERQGLAEGGQALPAAVSQH